MRGRALPSRRRPGRRHRPAHPSGEHSRLDCRYAQGLITTVPTVFGLPPARIRHDECESDGHPLCTYALSWERRNRLRRRPQDADVEMQLAALRGQLRALQSAGTELIAGADLGTVLPRIVARAAEAVVAPAYLLAVRDPDGGAPLVHSAGVPASDVPELVDRLLDGGDLGSRAVVVEVASARRRHGRLAVLYGPGYGAMGDEELLLQAYAGHAAAALDLLIPAEDALRLLSRTRMAAEDVPELLGMLGDRAPRVLDDRSSSPVVQGLLRRIGTSDLVAVPLVAGETFLGVATVGWATEETTPRLGDDVLTRLTGVADQASTALEKARLLATVRHQASHDSLTGLPDRVLFVDSLERSRGGIVPGCALAVLFCDLDRFEQVNDTLGLAVELAGGTRTADDLLREADAAMFRHEQRGRAAASRGAGSPV